MPLGLRRPSEPVSCHPGAAWVEVEGHMGLRLRDPTSDCLGALRS